LILKGNFQPQKDTKVASWVPPLRRRSDFYSKAQITLMAVQKMQVVVQKMQVQNKNQACDVK